MPKGDKRESYRRFSLNEQLSTADFATNTYHYNVIALRSDETVAQDSILV
jgi:hypothetical protein